MTPESFIEQARAARRAGDLASAFKSYRSALVAGADRAYCLRHIGDLARELGDSEGARSALAEAEALYRETDDALGLANTLRLLALIDGEAERWREARALYVRAAAETGLPLAEAIAECDRGLSAA